MRYRVDGRGDRDGHVVLIHGVGSNLTAWDRIAEVLSLYTNVVRYSLPGHGGSPTGSLPYTLDGFVADYVYLLELLKIERAHLVGFSLGGMIAQSVAVSRPDLVDRLIVIGAVAGRTSQEQSRVLERLRLAQRDGVPQSADRWFTSEFLKREPETVARNLQRMTETGPAAYVSAYKVLATNDLAADLHRITAPTLAMTGEHDAGSPPHMTERIARSVHNGQSLVLKGLRHCVLDEAPLLVADELMKFLGDD